MENPIGKNNYMKIEIPQDAKKIGVLFSGGMDSSILLYLLCKQKSENQIIYTFTAGRRDITNKVISFIKKQTDVDIRCHKINREWIRPMVEKLLKIYEMDVVFSGCNLVVEDEFNPTIHIPQDTPPWRGPSYNNQHLRPFIYMDKIEVLKLYLDNDVLDMLNLTYSCGFDKGPCYGCYFCMERKWAIDSLKLGEQYK